MIGRQTKTSPPPRGWPFRLAASAAILAGVASCVGRPPPPRTKQPITIAVSREPLGSLVVIAAEKGFFADAGLDATIVDKYPSGKRALAGMLAGEVDVAPTAEVPIVFQSFGRDDFAVVATIGSSDNEPKIVARKDRGISEPADLRGKRVGTQKASAVHYFLHLFLLRHGIPDNEVDIQYLKAEELPPALAEGEIDAFSMREPFVSEAKELVGEEAIVFAEPGLYVKTFNLVALKPVIEKKPEAIGRVLESLVRAESFARDKPQDAITLVADRFGVDRAALEAEWDQFDLRVSLGQELLGALEDEARWVVGSGFVEDAQVPNYLEYLHIDSLEHVKPSAVTVVH